jgi:hypothetical protein
MRVLRHLRNPLARAVGVSAALSRPRLTRPRGECMFHGMKFLLWLILLAFCWPLALAALVLYPVAWLVLLPFRVVGITVNGLLAVIKALFLLPARILGGGRA